MALPRGNSTRKQNSTPTPDVSSFVIRDLESTIDPHSYLMGRNDCNCDMCYQKAGYKKVRLDSNIFRTSTRESSSWLKSILDGLCLSGAKSLRIQLPDIIFIGETLEIYQTNRKDGRLAKATSSVPLKSLYPTMVRLRREYKTLLEENFNEKMLNTIDRSFMHIKYFNKFVPPHFTGGTNNRALLANRSQFKRYILHKNKKYEIQQLEEHKMNQKEPFCLVKYKDGNCTLFNQIQFEVFSLTHPAKLQEDVVYVQSYIKYKLETEAIYFSEYTLGELRPEVDARAERQVTLLIGGMHKYDEGWADIEHVEEADLELMLNRPKEYVELMTYKMVHYLAMTSNIYVDHFKLKWIINDIGNIYLQEILELVTSEVPKRLIKFRLPPKEEPAQYFHDAQGFGEMYKEMRRKKAVSTQKIRSQLEGKTYEEMLKMMDPDSQLPNFSLHSSITPQIRRQFAMLRQQGKKKGKSVARIESIEPEQLPKSGRYDNPEEEVVSKRKKVSLREQSVNLEKWRNVGQSADKEKAASGIQNNFTFASSLKEPNLDRREVRTQGRLRRSIDVKDDFRDSVRTAVSWRQKRKSKGGEERSDSKLSQRVKEKLTFTIE